MSSCRGWPSCTPELAAGQMGGTCVTSWRWPQIKEHCGRKPFCWTVACPGFDFEEVGRATVIHLILGRGLNSSPSHASLINPYQPKLSPQVCALSTLASTRALAHRPWCAGPAQAPAWNADPLPPLRCSLQDGADKLVMSASEGGNLLRFMNDPNISGTNFKAPPGGLEVRRPLHAVRAVYAGGGRSCAAAVAWQGRACLYPRSCCCRLWALCHRTGLP